MKRIEIMSIVLSALAVLGLAGLFYAKQKVSIAAPIAQGSPTPEVNPQAIDSKLVAAQTDFGFKLFSQILQQEANQNVFISPSSVSLALAMTYNGASGETQEAMAKALALQGMTLREINQGNAALIKSLETLEPDVKLSLANSLWARQGVDFRPEFLQRTQDFYSAKVTNLNFDDPAAKSVINDWVKQSTNGKIEEIIDQIKTDSVLFLINAIYFKGNWANEFSKEATEVRPFTLLNGSKKQHPLMLQSRKFQYFENNLFQSVNLPYGKGRLSMYVFLPKQGVTLQKLYDNLNAQNWQQWMQQFRRREGAVGLPRFKLEYETELNDTLKALGMEVAFDPDRADFSAMRSIPPNLSISKVKHKSFVDVNEEGTEAAAATSVEIIATSAILEPEKPFRLIADRPFFFAIRDNQTGTVLFMGSVVEPK